MRFKAQTLLPPAKNDITASGVAGHLLSMINEANDTSRLWMQYYIALQSGFALGVGAAIAFWQSQADKLGAGFGIVPMVLAVLGAALGSMVVRIVLRAHQWQAWFIRRLDAVILCNAPLTVSPGEDAGKDVISGLPPGYTADLIDRANRIIVAAWLVAAFAVLLLVLWTLQRAGA